MMTASPGGSWSLAEPIFQDSTFPISGYSPGLRKEMNPLQLPMLLQIYLLATKQHIVHRKRVWQVNEARGQGEMPWMSSSALRQCSYGAVSKPVRFQEEINWNYFWHHGICEPYCGAPSPGTPECVRDDLFFDKHQKKKREKKKTRHGRHCGWRTHPSWWTGRESGVLNNRDRHDTIARE